MSAQEKEEETGEGGSVWTSYSDLFMTVAVVFLIMFIFSMLSAGVTKVEAIKAKQESEDELQAKVPERVKEETASKMAIAKATMEEIEAKKKKIEESVQELTKLTESLNKSQSAISDLYKEQIRKDGMISAAAINIENKQQTLKEQKQQIEALETTQMNNAKQVAQLDQKIALLEGKITDSEKAKSKLEEAIEKKEQKQIELQQSIKEIQAQLSKSEQAAANLAKQKSKTDTEVKKIRDDLSKTKAVVGAQSSEVKNLQDALRNKEAEIENLNQGVGNLQMKQAKLQQELSGKSGELAEAEGKIADLNGELQGKNSDLAGAKKEVGQLTGQLGAKGKELGAAGKEIAGLKSALSEALGEMEGMGGALAGKQAELKSLEGQMAKATSRLNQLANERRDIAKAISTKLRNGGVEVHTDPNTGVLTIDMDDAFYFKNNSAELSASAQEKIRQIIPLYAQAIFGDPKIAAKIAGVTITGFASPRYKRKFINPNEAPAKAYSYNLQLSMERASSIATFVFSENNGDFAHSQTLKKLTSVSGKGFMQPILVNEDTAAADTCGPYDCQKSRRVEIGFVLKRDSGVDKDIRSITELMAH